MSSVRAFYLRSIFITSQEIIEFTESPLIEIVIHFHNFDHCKRTYKLLFLFGIGVIGMFISTIGKHSALYCFDLKG